jgi:hypothetical protein
MYFLPAVGAAALAVAAWSIAQRINSPAEDNPKAADQVTQAAAQAPSSPVEQPAATPRRSTAGERVPGLARVPPGHRVLSHRRSGAQGRGQKRDRLCGCGAGHLGLLLRSHSGRIVNGKCLRALPRKAAGVPWTVELPA